MPSNASKKRGAARSNKKKGKRKSSNVDNIGAEGSTAAAAPPQPKPRSQQRWNEELIRSRIGHEFKLNDFPMSKYCVIGWNLARNDENGHALKAYKMGAESDSCVWCIFCYAEILRENDDKIHNAFPWYLEGAIRGHVVCMERLCNHCYRLRRKSFTTNCYGLNNFWSKIAADIDPSYKYNWSHDERIERREEFRSTCHYCGRKHLPEMHLCEGCRVYSYYSKECQRKDWKGTRNHRGECRQLKILKHYYRNDAKVVRDAITGGIDPKTIDSLQTLRTELGLNRPEEDYEQLLQLLDDDETKDMNQSPNRYEYFTGRPKDGTLHIGSTPNLI